MSRSLCSALLLTLCSTILPACGPTSAGSLDLSVSGQSDLATRDMRVVTDQAMPSADLTPSSIGACLPLDTYCGYGGNFCVRNWTNAQDPAKWCTPGKDVNIYIPTAPCADGRRVITLGGANFYDNKQYFYSPTGDGQLLGVVSVGEFGTYLCDAEDASYASLMYTGCTYGPAAQCVNGVIQ